MKCFKCVVLVLIILLAIGCKKEYSLIISDDGIIEKFHIVVDKNSDNTSLLRITHYPLHANDTVMYEQSIRNKNNDIIGDYKYNYSLYDFVNANYINQCFENKKIIVDDDEFIELDLSNITGCMTDYDMDVNIITDNDVISNNADDTKGNKYIWHMTNDNKDDFRIQIKIKKGTNKKQVQFANYVVYIVLGIIIIVGIIFVIKTLKKKNEKDSF